MANLKNIKDLPVVESTDGLNLIVEDNGNAKRIAANAVSGASSWNDLKDKPFYEEVTEIGGDTLTWDGNMEGLITATDKTIVRISDITPPKEALTNGAILVKSDGTTYDIEFSDNGDYMSGGGRWSPLIIVYSPGGQFPEPGLYAGRARKTTGEVVWTSSVTIPGYTGFVSKQTVIKPIDTKYLPKQLQIGEEFGILDILPETEYALTEIDDIPGAAVIEFEEKIPFVAGATCVVTWNGVEYECVCAEIFDLLYVGDAYLLSEGAVASTGEPFCISAHNSDDYSSVASFDGSTKATVSIRQKQEIIRKLDEKYLPKVGGVMLYASAFTNNPYIYHDAELNTKVSKTELQEIVKSSFFCVEDHSTVYYPLFTEFGRNYAKVILPDNGNVPKSWFCTSEYVSPPM